MKKGKEAARNGLLLFPVSKSKWKGRQKRSRPSKKKPIEVLLKKYLEKKLAIYPVGVYNDEKGEIRYFAEYYRMPASGQRR